MKIKQLTILLGLACMSLAQASQIQIGTNQGRFSVDIQDPNVIKNIQKIASCPVKRKASLTDYYQVALYGVTGKDQVLADFLASKCLDLNNPDLYKQVQQTGQDMDKEVVNSVVYARDKETLTYLITAQANINLPAYGEDVLYYLASQPTYFTATETARQRQYGVDALAEIQKKIGNLTPNDLYNVDLIKTNDAQTEKKWDEMLATLIGWKADKALDMRGATPGSPYLVHNLAYFGRVQSLAALHKIDYYNIAFSKVNVSGEKPIMTAFTNYCGITNDWERANAYQTQSYLINQAASLDLYQKNGYGQSFADYFQNFVKKNPDATINKALTTQIEQKAPNMLKNAGYKEVKITVKNDFCGQ